MQQIAVLNEGTSRGHRIATGVTDSADVHRLHTLLRMLSAGIVSLPARPDSAPGHYAVYFTDDTRGVHVEYVHRSNDGGES